MTSRDRVASLIRQAADRSGLRDTEIARRAKLAKATLANAIKTGSIRVDTLFRILEACDLELVDIRVRKRSENNTKTEIVVSSAPKA